jgi:hypothetical protein
MKNVTIAIDERLLERARDYARRHNTSLNALIRSLLERTTLPPSPDALGECFRQMDRAGGDSKGVRWRREELHRG